MPKKQDGYVDVWEVTREMQRMLAGHSKLLLSQYKTIKGIYGWPNKALMDTVMEMWPNGTGKFFDIFDMWLEDQVRIFDTNMEESVADYVKTVSDLEFTAPNAEHYRMLVGEHTKLWLENYKKVRERREEANRVSLDSLKQMLPLMVHPILENAYKWLSEQNERIERQIIEQMKSLTADMESDGD